MITGRALPALIFTSALWLNACDSTQESQVSVAGESSDAGAQIAAAVPDTEIFLAELTWTDGMPALGRLRNISNRGGYDNQPGFLEDGRSLVFSAIVDGKQSDIYRYLISENASVPYALTGLSEYSPTPIPQAGGISVVRVEADGTQRLWRFSAANATATLIAADVSGVGYHAWLRPDLVAVFIVGEPPTLELVSLPSGERKLVASNIGRSLARIPGDEALAFIDKGEAGAWRVVRYDLDSGALSELIVTPPGSEDFAWSGNGGMFMGSDQGLLYWDGHPDTQWTTVELGNQRPGRITRIAVSPDIRHIALVVDLVD